MIVSNFVFGLLFTGSISTLNSFNLNPNSQHGRYVQNVVPSSLTSSLDNLPSRRCHSATTTTTMTRTSRLPFSLNEHENEHENKHENKHENENDVEPNASNNNGNMIDSLSRCRLLFSMLATAGATSSIMSNPAMASDQPLVNDNRAVETEPSLSIATSLRGDGYVFSMIFLTKSMKVSCSFLYSIK
jgi:hypothetical protein